MNCRNCGMPVVGNKCDYCGTMYGNIGWVCNKEQGAFAGLLDKEGEFYIANVELFNICSSVGRDMNGHLIREKPTYKRKVVLIEK